MRVWIAIRTIQIMNGTTKFRPFHGMSMSTFRKGKRVVNFSDWGRYTKVEKIGLLGEIIEEVEEGKMPLKSYTLMHKNAKLKTSDKERFENWVKTYAEELLMEK